jgi:phospholipase/carboxylesterase
MNDEAAVAPDTAVIEELTIDWKAYFAVQTPSTSSETPPALLIAAHGYGQSCKNFIRSFASLREKNYLVVAPQGPNQFYWQESGKVGFCWMTRYMRLNTIDLLMQYMARLIETLRVKWPFDEDRVFILGFSQGSALAFRLGASGIVKPRGVIACGGDLPPDVAERLDSIAKFPVLIVHGVNDSSMSFAKAREGEDILRKHGFAVDTRYFDGGHDLTEEQIQRILAWMDERG